MTEREFFTHLEESGADWRVADGGWLRASDQCPITAVYTAATGRPKSSGYWRSCAKALGLDPTLAYAIMRVADNPYPTPLRSKLLTACGLKAGYHAPDPS